MSATTARHENSASAESLAEPLIELGDEMELSDEVCPTQNLPANRNPAFRNGLSKSISERERA